MQWPGIQLSKNILKSWIEQISPNGAPYPPAQGNALGTRSHKNEKP